MKRIISLFTLLFSLHISFAQRPDLVFTDEKKTTEEEMDEPSKFWQNVFVGGSINFGYYETDNSSYSTFGLVPEIGYSLNSWAHIGVVFNGNYTYRSIRDNVSQLKETYNIWNFGAGIFARAFITPEFFLQIQPEFNTFSVTQKYSNITNKDSYSSNSFLVGIGYGRQVVGQVGYYTSLMLDLKKETFSPYRDVNGNMLPIVRSGFVFYLGKRK